MAFFRWLTGGTQAKSARTREAEACFTPAELDGIKGQVQQAARVQGGPGTSGLQERTFLHILCGWPISNEGSAPHLDLGRALFRTCAGFATRDSSNSPVPTDPSAGLGWAWGDDGDEPQAASSAGSSPLASKVATLEDIVAAKAACERLGTSDSNAFAFELCARLPRRSKAGAAVSTGGSTALGPERIHALIAAVVSLLTVADSLHWPAGAHKAVGHDTAEDAWVSAIARGAMWAAAGPAAAAPAGAMDADGFARWARACPAVVTVLTSLLSGVGVVPADTDSSNTAPHTHTHTRGQHPPSHTPHDLKQHAGGTLGAAYGQGALPGRLLLPQGPQLLLSPATQAGSNSNNTSGSSAWFSALAGAILLHPLAAWVLSHSLPLAQRREWRLVFHSQRDGQSYNTFMARLGSVDGATLVLVREKGGHVVGGYAPAPWRKQGSFFGDHSTWVARLLPDLQVFTSTGANTNFQWCGQGFSQLTNGIGFGGAHGGHSAFALLIDSTLDSGHSRPIATFGNPSLTSTQVFQIDTVECWLVQPPEPSDTEDKSTHSGNSMSVLDKKRTDRVFMDLAGRQVNHSAGLRADEPIED